MSNLCHENDIFYMLAETNISTSFKQMSKVCYNVTMLLYIKISLHFILLGGKLKKVNTEVDIEFESIHAVCDI